MSDKFEIIIEPKKLEKNYWTDLWRYRELFYILSWRDLKVRYKQTIIGVAWSVIKPVLTIIIFTFIFNKIAGFDSGRMPYTVFVLAGLLPWQFFSNAFVESSNSLIGNEKLISKIYFPRLIIPVSSIITSIVDFLLSFVILLALFVFYQFLPSWKIILVPIFFLISFLFSIGTGLWVAALNVKYRDFRYITPFIVQFGLYISPVGFGLNMIPEKYHLLYSLNPMVGVIDGFRWCISGDRSLIYFPSIFLSVFITILFLWIGVSQFRKMEKSFADII
ncbi:MAG TPA: ABC transporter permease [Niabella sp.]|nr:ABC transporter permease [Candidatus Woesebacteria bacterium]HUN01681.1 ABC transporter permease [Niabella sp.]